MIKYYFIDVNAIKQEYLDKYGKLDKYSTYTNEAKRNEKIARDLLFSYMVKKENIDPEIVYNEYGKPYFKNSKLYFNVSHSNKKVLIALSDSELGIDIQKISNYDEERIDKLAKRIYNDNDYNYFNNDENVTFTQIWTIKEAYLKYVGYGLIKNLHDIVVEYNTNSVYLMNRNPSNFYTCYCGDYIVSVVTNKNIPNNNEQLKNNRIYYQGEEVE